MIVRPLVVPVFISHAGCPYRCVFCNQKIVTNHSPTAPHPGLIDAALDTYLAPALRRPARIEISFYGGTFLGLPQETVQQLLGAAQVQVDSGRVDALRFSTRPDTVDSRSLAAIAPFSVGTVEVGVQSMDDAVLARARRGHSASASRRAVALLKGAGYRVGVQLMVGLPAESEAGLARTLAATAEMMPDFVRIYPTLVLPDSVLAGWHQAGRYIPLSLSQAVARTKSMFSFFYRRKIPVVRMGLQPTDSLSAAVAGGEVAGPYHPAFGHLVHETLFLEAASLLLKRSILSTTVIKVHPASISVMRGLGNANSVHLKAHFGLRELAVVGDKELAVGAISIGGRTLDAFAGVPEGRLCPPALAQ